MDSCAWLSSSKKKRVGLLFPALQDTDSSNYTSVLYFLMQKANRPILPCSLSTSRMKPRP